MRSKSTIQFLQTNLYKFQAQAHLVDKLLL